MNPGAWKLVEKAIFKGIDKIVDFAKDNRNTIGSALAIVEGAIALAMSGFAIIGYFIYKVYISLLTSHIVSPQRDIDLIIFI